MRLRDFSIILLSFCISNLGQAQVILGSEGEKRTVDPTYGQEHFSYRAGMSSLKLENKVDLGQNLFLSIPSGTTSCGSGKWVYGKDYQYNPDTNSIEFLQKEISPYAIGGRRDSNCKIDSGTIIQVFYRKDGEITKMRRKFGQDVSVRTLDYLEGSSNLKHECYSGAGGRLDVEHFQNGQRTSTVYFYGKPDIDAITKFTCKGEVKTAAQTSGTNGSGR